MTFDDGPSAVLTPKLLDLLKSKGIKATFFVLGENAVRNPEILKRAIAEGHEIGNHSWSHPILSKMSYDAVHSELQRTNDVILQATGKKPTLMHAAPPAALTARSPQGRRTGSTRISVTRSSCGMSIRSTGKSSRGNPPSNARRVSKM